MDSSSKYLYEFKTFFSDCNLKVGTSKYGFDRSEVEGGSKFTTNAKVSFMMALDLLSKRDPEFLKSFLGVLSNSVQFEAYFFETPPMTEKKVFFY